MVMIDGNRIEIGHSGDSRIYIISPGGKVKLLTRDHIYFVPLTLAPLAFPLEGAVLEEYSRIIENQPVKYKGVLAGAVDGRGKDLAVDTWEGELQKGDWVLMTSDGLIKTFGELKFHAFLASLRASGISIQEALVKIKEASSANWYDNVALIIFEA
jgi:serine/threonine protein phosphatase PrpC